MAVNLVKLVSKQLTPDLKQRMAGALGTDRKGVGRAANAAIPALLGSLAGLASSPEGPQKIDAAVRGIGPAAPGELAASLGGGGGRSLVDRGMRSLGALFGSSSVATLGNAVGKFSGLGQSTGSSLIAMLAPLVLGILGKEKADKGLDASGIARLLRKQKSDFAKAMPADFRRLLQTSGMAPPAGESGQRVREPAAQAAGPASTTAGARPAGRSRLIWGIPLLAVLGLALWYFTGRVGDMPGAGPAVVNGINLTSRLEETVTESKAILSGIDDEQSARVALPRLRTMLAELEGIRRQSERLTPEGRMALGRAAANAYPQVDRLAKQALSAPGVEAVAEIEIERLRTRLAVLSRG